MEATIGNGKTATTMGNRRRAKKHDVFKFEEGLSLAERVATYLKHHAENRPEVFVPYNELLKRVMGYPRLPAIGTKEVEIFRAKGPAIRLALLRLYRCGLVSSVGYGWRATVSAEDISLHVIPKQVARAAGSVRAVHSTMEIIDVRKLSGARRAWYEQHVGKLSAMAKQIEAAKKALPAHVEKNGE